MKLLKFGKIYEGEDGVLVFDSFHADCEGASFRHEDLLDMVIERLQKEKKAEPGRVERRVRGVVQLE